MNKYSYIDGVPFAINPLFINDNQNAKNLIIESDQLVSNLNKALSIIDSKYEFTLELKSLKVYDDKKKKKEHTNSILNNKKLRNKTQNETTNPQQTTSVFSNDLQSNQPVLNNIPNNDKNTNQQSIIQPLIPTANYSVLLEPIRNDNSTHNKNDHKETSQDNLNSHKDIFIDSTQSLDPFNDCELKTINDFEELKNILNNHQLEQQKQLHNQHLLSSQPAQFFQTNSKACPVDSFGLPIVDLDINSNKIN